MKKIRKLEKMKNLISTCFIFILLVSSSSIYAQKDSITLQREARKLVREGNVLEPCIPFQFIVLYGVYKTRKMNSGVEDYIKGGKDTKWWTIGLSRCKT